MFEPDILEVEPDIIGVEPDLIGVEPDLHRVPRPRNHTPSDIAAMLSASRSSKRSLREP